MAGPVQPSILSPGYKQEGLSEQMSPWSLGQHPNKVPPTDSLPLKDRPELPRVSHYN